MKLYAFVILSGFMMMIVSCLGIDETITISGDNSGSISYTYRIAKEISDLGSYGEIKRPIPLPVLRKDFERVLQDKKGLRLLGYSSIENEKDIVIKAEIAFASISALDGLSMPDDSSAKSETAGNSHSLTLVIPSAGNSEISDDSIEMIREMSAGYDIVLTVRTPGNVLSHTLGDVSKDDRSVTYKTTVYDLVKAKQNQLFTITW